jgi:Tfp pilus assembly PilM family ATPase
MKDLSRPQSFFKYFPAPEYLSLSNTGVAIDDECVRLIELHRSLFGQAFKLRRYKKLSLPEGVVQSGFLYNPGKITETLKNLSEEASSHYVRATLPEEKAYVFTAFINRVPSEGLRDAVAFIIEENVPVSLAESVFDFNVVESASDENQIKVVVAVLPQKIISSYTEALESAGLTPVSYDIESQAIARALVPWGDKSTNLIINISKKKTGFYIVEDSLVQFTTTLPHGSTTTEHLGNLKTEIRKIFAFWGAKSEKPGLPPKKIAKVILCGAGSLDHSFVSRLMEEIEVEYGWGDPWTNLSGGGLDIPKELSRDALEYVPAIGLALPPIPK